MDYFLGDGRGREERTENRMEEVERDGEKQSKNSKYVNKGRGREERKEGRGNAEF